jgi:hypothetical protein
LPFTPCIYIPPLAPGYLTNGLNRLINNQIIPSLNATSGVCSPSLI